MSNGWPARPELCAFVQGTMAAWPPDDRLLGKLTGAVRSRWPHLSAPEAMHLARIGQRTDWAPEPRREPWKPRQKRDQDRNGPLVQPTLRHLREHKIQNLFPVCDRCGYKGLVALDRLIERFGPEQMLSVAITYLSCTWCEGRTSSALDDRPPGPGQGRRLE